MNRDAKIGLFSVLTLVVLVAVIWFKVSGDSDKSKTQPDASTTGSIASTPTNTGQQTGSTTSSVTRSTANPLPRSTTTTSSTARRTGTTGSTVTSQGTSATGQGSTTATTTRSGGDDVADLFSRLGRDLGESTTATPGSATRTVSTSADTTGSRTADTGNDWMEEILNRRTTETPAAVIQTDPRETSVATDYTRTTTVATTGWPKEHTVAASETMTAIAVKYYGESIHWKVIAEANTSVDPNRMQVGAKLTIPKMEAVPAAPTATATTASVGATTSTRTALIDRVSETPRAGWNYKVQRGDTLTSIARSVYGKDSWRVIYDANRDRLAAPDRIVIGMTLYIPERQ